MRSPLSTTSDRGCGKCGDTPSYLTPDGLRCREHIHREAEWDDWLPLSRKSKSTAQRPSGRARSDAA